MATSAYGSHSTSARSLVSLAGGSKGDGSSAALAAKILPARAVILYGRVGTYETRTASLKKGMPADEGLWRTCAASIRMHVVRPWMNSGRVDVFVQSWNPELAQTMEAFWQPRSSFHGAQNTSLGRSPVKLQYSDRTMWALLGMKRALALRSAWAESAEGRGLSPHATVLVMRHDVIWASPMPPLRADRSVRLWLPFDCHRSACRDRTARASDLYAEAPPTRASCADGSTLKGRASSNWTVLNHKTSVRLRRDSNAASSSLGSKPRQKPTPRLERLE